MLNIIKKNVKATSEGFTLIEVLVVLAILGMIAAVVIPNVIMFIDNGRIESANTELHNVRLAIQAYSYDNGTTDIDGTLGSDGTNDGTLNGNSSLGQYVLNINNFQAIYTIIDGRITDAVADPSGKWSSLTWDTYCWE